VIFKQRRIPLHLRKDDARVEQGPGGGSEAVPAPSPAVPVFGAVVAVAVLLICFFTPRSPGMEEAGVFNAAYTYAHYGKMAFPIYGTDFSNSFGIHPHLHYAILGLLIRLGLTLYSAEGAIIAAIALVAIALILLGKFPDTVKLGFLAGLYGTIVLAVMYLPDHAAGVRPELHVSIAWFAGLIALESARLDGWDLPKLCLGTLLVAYAAAMQNYALLAPAGLGVYAVWMVCEVPRREAVKKIAAGALALCVVGIPFVLLYAYPNWDMIRANMSWGTTHSAPLGSKLAAYFEVYDTEILPGYRRDLFSSFFAIGPVLGALLLRIPLFAAVLGLLLVRRATRGIGLAFLPVPLLVLWTLPKAHYFISEQLIFLGAFWSGALGGCECLARKLRAGPTWPVVPVLSAFCCAALLLGSPPLREVHPLAGMPLHEMDVARAAARQIIGPRALVASRHLAWYTSGGSEWYRLESDVTEPATLEHFDSKLYAAQFDALADYPVFSWQTQSGITPASMYADGAIQLKGFFLAQRMRGLSFVLFQSSRSGRVTGYCLRNDELQRFDEDDSGPVVFLTVKGPRDGSSDLFTSLIYERNILDLPGDPPTVAISAYIASRDAYLTKRTGLPAEFKILDAVFGRLSPVDARALVKASLTADLPIRFLKTPYQQFVTNFLARRDHPVARADGCAVGEMRPAYPEAPISSGRYAAGFEAGNVFDDKDSTWGSEKLGPHTEMVSYIGADFGVGHPIEVRAIGLRHGPDPDSSIGSAVLMASTNGYDWRPEVELALNTGGAMHTYCVPPAGAYRFWKLMAADNPKRDHAWQIVTLTFYQ
jgi:hypothetical protein